MAKDLNYPKILAEVEAWTTARMNHESALADKCCNPEYGAAASAYAEVLSFIERVKGLPPSVDNPFVEKHLDDPDPPSLEDDNGEPITGAEYWELYG